jgi:hypothetical protein
VRDAVLSGIFSARHSHDNPFSLVVRCDDVSTQQRCLYAESISKDTYRIVGGNARPEHRDPRSERIPSRLSFR